MEVARELAKRKAKKVFDSNNESIVIGSDQVIAYGDKILGKPKTKESNRAVKLITKWSSYINNCCVYSIKEKSVCFDNVTKLTIRQDLTNKELKNYVEHDLPLNCAGSYKIEGMGIALFEKVETSDFTSIIGLPLMQTSKHLKDFGIEVFQ